MKNTTGKVSLLSAVPNYKGTIENSSLPSYVKRGDAQSVVFQPVFIRMLKIYRWLREKEKFHIIQFEEQFIMFKKILKRSVFYRKAR